MTEVSSGEQEVGKWRQIVHLFIQAANILLSIYSVLGIFLRIRNGQT